MYKNVKTPCYVVDERLLVKNLEVLKDVADRTDCNILLAQKAFSMYSTYPLIRKFLNGTTASSLFEAKLGKEEFGGETHIFSPAYIPNDFDEIAKICDHIVFNSFSEFRKYKSKLKGTTSCGIRINPKYSEVETAIYDPCGFGSRLGVTLSNFEEDEIVKGEIEGLHFHTMCEQNADTLKNTLDVIEEKFGKYLELSTIKWLNFGGGHHITRDDYDIKLLVELINKMKRKYNVQIYLEPGEAIALNVGFLVSEVIGFVDNEIVNAILDTSAACHMPDVIEMPYRPNVIGDTKNGEYKYRFGGPTCLAGDIIGDYAFDKPLEIGDRVVFCDMAIYTMVKNNTFNGMNLPSIYKIDQNGKTSLVREFSYEDFKERLS